MPTTRHSRAETPGRDAQQKQQKIGQRPSAQNSKTEVTGSKTADVLKAEQSIENVRSTRRSQTVPETSAFVSRRTRGTKVEPIEQEEPASGKKTRKDVVKSDDAKQAEAGLTRSSKRTAGSPKDVGGKKQRISPAMSPKLVETTDVVKKPVATDVKKDEEKKKESNLKWEKSDAKKDEKCSDDTAKFWQKNLKNEDESVKVKAVRIQKSTTSVSDTVGSVSGIDVMSPRRSSRTVVPNSRYRDMVEPGKKKSVIKTEIKKETNAPPPKKKKVDYTAISVQRQGESEEITEEVITEETKIDTFAQMNLMDDMLILPPSSANMLEAQQADSEPESSTTTSSTGVKVIKYQGAKLIEYESDALGISNLGSDVLVETKLQIPGDTSKEVSDDSSAAYDNDLTGTAKSLDNLLQSGAIPEPQVIVIPSDSGKHVSKIIIPKDPYRARLEQAFEKKGSSMVIGPSIGKAKPKKIIVTPTHQHASKKEAQRTKMASNAENIQLKETGFGKDLGKATVTSVIYPQLKMPGARTAPILHTPEKYVKYTVLPRKESKTSAEVNLHCDEEATEMASTSSGVNDRNSAEVNVKVVYVKAKQKHVSNAELDASENLLPDQDDGSSDNTVLDAESLQNKVVETGVASAEHIKANESEIENTAISNSEHVFLDLRGKEKTSSTEGSKSLELVEEVTSVPVEQKIANALCQVIEYKQPQPQTAIEYVLLDNKMVPIHKPYQTGSHSRHNVRQAQPVNRVTPGRVEPGAQKEQSSDKKRPLSAAQTGISTVITQIGDGHSQSLTPVNHHSKYTISSCQLEVADAASSEEVQPDVQTARVIHGYIDHPVRGGSPTEIVEISTEAFNKEIYGEEITLDTVTGQIVEGTVDETSQDVSETESQSVEDAAGFQPMEQTDVNQSEESSENQSVIEVTQSRIVKADNEATVIYTEGEEGSHVEDITSWSVGTPIVTSDTGMIMTVPASEANVSARDALVHLEGLDETQIPENATITVEKLASGGEIVIMQIKETAVSETLEKIKTSESDVGGSTSGFAITKSPAIVKAKVIKKTSSGLKILPVQKLSEVKITPVRAYNKSGTESSNKGESSAGVVSKTTGTNTESSDAEDTELEEEEEEGIKFEETSPSKGNPYQEYIVVRLPEGAEVKQLQARPRMETKPLGEEVTMDEEGMYICVDCGHKTENRGNWFKHRRKHLGIRPHACPKCSYRAATSSNLKRHMQIHDDVRNFQCAYCNTLFRQKIHLERHLKYKHEEKNVQCPLCDYVCSSENPDLKIHIKRRHMPHEGALNAFTCDVCGLMTVSKKDLKQHKKFHKNGPELKLFCEHCSFVTDCVSRLRRHMLIHTKERPFQCGLCTYRATQKEHVLRHMRSQHGVEVERNQRRSLLEKNYHNPQEILVAGMDQSSSSSNKEVPSESDLGPFEKSDYSSTDKIFACNYCSMKFSKLINLYKHLYAQHKQVMPDEGPNDFQCVVCDFRTNNKKNLLVHMRKHNMQDHSPPTHVYSCVLCRYINPRRRNLFQHMKKKHGIEIIMKDDGLNCYVTLENAAAQVQGQNVKSSVMALSDIVTTQTMDDAAQNLFIGESGEDTSTFQSEKITIDNIISDDMESYVVTDSSQEQGIVSPQVSVSTIPHASVQEHEAAEAIEGLQALAEQAGILETQNIDNDMTTEIVSSAIEIESTEIMNDGEVLNADQTMMTTEAAAGEQPGQATEEGFELSTEQLNQLATGDYVEINGEVYKVEIAPEAS